MIECKKRNFDLPEDVSYLNCANISPLMHVAAQAGIEIIDRRRRPYTIAREEWFEPVETLKKNFAQMINCKDHRRIALIPSVSYGIATVVQNMTLDPNEEILVVAEQYPSNYYSWKSLADKTGARMQIVTPEKASKNRGELWNQRILDAISPQTKVVTIGNVHWADGTLFNLEQIGEKARRHGALLIIDASQSLGALPFDVQEVKPDALFTVGYKWLLGPFSLGMGYFGKFFDNGRPLEENWVNRKHSANFQNLVQYTDEYGPLAARYNMGQNSNFHLVPILNQSIAALNAWGISNIQDYCRKLTEQPVELLRKYGCIIEEDEFRTGHLFGIRFSTSKDLNVLQERFLKDKIYVSLRGSSVRISVNVYNDENDMDRLVGSIQSFLKGRTYHELRN